MVKKTKKTLAYAAGGAATTAQGLPKAAPVAGFNPGPESNQFGSWGAAVESGGIPGSTEGLQQVGNQVGTFNPGDQVTTQGIAAPAPNVASTYYKPSPTPPAPSAVYNFNTATATPAPPPPAAASAPPAAAPTSHPATAAQMAAQQGYITQNGQLYYDPTAAQQYLGSNPIGVAEGGAIPAYDDGGDVGDSPMNGVRSAISMARQSFGLDDQMFQQMLGGTDG